MPPLNTYSMPGRRGLALTCGDTVQFDDCSTCDPGGIGVEVPCPEWSITVLSGTAPAGTAIDPATGLLTIGPDCTGLDAPAEIEVTVEDPCNSCLPDSVVVVVGEVVLAVSDLTTAPGGEGVQVAVTMSNPDHRVKAIQTDIADQDNYLTCTGCAPDPDRALEYICSANDLGDTCRVVMTSTNPSGMIEEGKGVVFTVDYAVSDAAPSDDCIDITPTDSKVSDQFGCPLCVCEETGEICFKVCGDIYPRECLPEMPNCGDGVIDIFDILEEIDFILSVVIPSDCQETRADVPIGTPPYCGCIGDEVCLTDGVVDIFDVLVIIDATLGKANCCDYCATGQIY